MEDAIESIELSKEMQSPQMSQATAHGQAVTAQLVGVSSANVPSVVTSVAQAQVGLKRSELRVTGYCSDVDAGERSDWSPRLRLPREEPIGWRVRSACIP